MNPLNLGFLGAALSSIDFTTPYGVHDKNPYQGNGRGGNGRYKTRKRRVSASAKGSHNRQAVLKRAKKRAVRAKKTVPTLAQLWDKAVRDSRKQFLGTVVNVSQDVSGVHVEVEQTPQQAKRLQDLLAENDKPVGVSIGVRAVLRDDNMLKSYMGY